MTFSKLVVLKFVRTRSPRAWNPAHSADRQRISRRLPCCPEQAGQAGVPEAGASGTVPKARNADGFGVGWTALERLCLIMLWDILKAGAVSNHEPLGQDWRLARARLAVGAGVAWDPPVCLGSSCSLPLFVL